jgi:ABC-type branched-subunit amino acid transport system ATPase component
MPKFRRFIWGKHMAEPILQIRNLNVYYGAAHVLQGVDLTLTPGIHSVLGRNGMGKTTLCNAIMGLVPVESGEIALQGEPIQNLPSHKIAKAGIGYTPQGRRLWKSLTVDEHLRLGAQRGSKWPIARVYETFPRLAERKGNGGAALSGGEQQMLAIARALQQDPKVLILDEPTEGLAPVIVQHVEEILTTLVAETDVAVLLVEQNIRVATAISNDIAVMVNGRIATVLPAAKLAGDTALQQKLLGVGRQNDRASVEI